MLLMEMTAKDCRGILTRISIGRLGCSHGDQPYVLPIFLCMSLTISMDSLLTDGHKIEWMRTNPKVCVEIDGITNDFQRTSVVVCGGYRELLDLPPSAEEATMRGSP